MTHILEQIVLAADHNTIDKLHLAVEKKPFLQRYLDKKGEKFTLLDHYRHLCQLKCLYETFTKRLMLEFNPKLPDNLICLLQRADKIRKDLEFLRPHIAEKNRDNILESTIQYDNYLQSLSCNNEFLVHFLVTILGDLNGGQFLKHRVQESYKEKNLFSEQEPNNGVSFYHFDKGTAGNLITWLKTFIEFKEIGKNDNKYQNPEKAKLLGKGAIDAFKMQTRIIDELEATRVIKAAQNSLGFFNGRNLVQAAVAGATIFTAGMAAGVTLTNTIYKCGN